MKKERGNNELALGGCHFIFRHNNQLIVGVSNGRNDGEDARPGRIIGGVLSLHSGWKIEQQKNTNNIRGGLRWPPLDILHATMLIYFKILVYTETRVATLSFLFIVRTVTRVIVTLLTFFRLTSFLHLYIGLEHGLHKGHTLIAPKLHVRLLGLRGLTCCCHQGAYHYCHSNGSPRCCGSG